MKKNEARPKSKTRTGWHGHLGQGSGDSDEATAEWRPEWRE